jgi:hypothetical protein
MTYAKLGLPVVDTRPRHRSKRWLDTRAPRLRHGLRRLVVVICLLRSLQTRLDFKLIVLDRNRGKKNALTSPWWGGSTWPAFALMLGCDVDKPRNLAKSVTVE